MTSRHLIRHPHRGRLSHAQWMVFFYGYDEKWDDAFRDDADYRETWEHHRTHILASYRHGRRPIAWWHLESPIPYPGYDRERQVLYERNLLGEEERAYLVASWRQDFERGHRWSDVPPSLWAEWEARRRTEEAVEPAKPPPAA
jgi:hypothetical protein